MLALAILAAAVVSVVIVVRVDRRDVVAVTGALPELVAALLR
ncbi:hypothetical protein [Streptomyces roseolus]|nr:hypothetical protein [Streptomyces roseolus]GGR67611.1 hypothetical protein GCM10010282_70630 [Streptomyces roseolus]